MCLAAAIKQYLRMEIQRANVFLFVRCTRGHFGINNHRPSILFAHFFHSHMNCRVNTNKIRNAIYGKAINFAVILTSHNQHCFRSTNIIYCTELDWHSKSFKFINSFYAGFFYCCWVGSDGWEGEMNETMNYIYIWVGSGLVFSNLMFCCVKRTSYIYVEEPSVSPDTVK